MKWLYWILAYVFVGQFLSCVTQAQDWVTTPESIDYLFSNADIVSVGGETLMITGGPINANTYNPWIFAWDGTHWTPREGGYPAAAVAVAETPYGVWLSGGWAGYILGTNPVLWDGLVYSDPVERTGPGPRFGAKAAYMPGVGVVMFGGYLGTWYGSVATDETWIFEFGGGEARAPAACPELGDAFGEVLGVSDEPDPEIRGAGSWRQVEAVGPSPRAGHAMEYVPEFGGVVVFGGGTGFYGEELADAWLFTGTAWVPVGGGEGPSPRMDVSGTTWAGGLLVTGGWGPLAGGDPPRCGYSSETWLLRPDGWLRLADVPDLAGRAGHASGLDRFGRPIIVGGVTGYSSAWYTHTFDLR